MKIKSVSGITCYVTDIEKTAAFYEALGFLITKKEANRLSVRLNWFWVDFVKAGAEEKQDFQKEARLSPRGSGIFVYLSVEDVDACHRELLEKGLTPSSEPKDWPWGNREFVIRDPDGYKLVLFKKK